MSMRHAQTQKLLCQISQNMKYKALCRLQCKTCKKNLVVERRVTEFLPEGLQSLLNYLLPVWHGELPQGKQESASFLGQGL